MMRKLLFAGVLVLAMSGLASAQDFPKFEDYLPTFRELKGTVRTTEDLYDVSTPTDFTQGVWQDTSDTTETVRMPVDRFNNIRLSTGIVFKF